MTVGRRTAAVVLLVSLASPAMAQWLYKGEESAFGNRGTHMVITANQIYGFGFRCEETGAAAVYMTPEALSKTEAEQFLTTFPRLMVRVDEKPMHDMTGFIDSAQDKLRITASAEEQLVQEIRDAKRRVAVAMKMGDKVFHESTFTVSGSTSALKKFLNACPFPAAEQ